MNGSPPIPKALESDEHEELELKYPTNHLKGFDELRKSTRLQGKEYILILKALWYSLLSCKNKNVVLKLNNLVTDGRIHLLIPLKSGKGKKELKRVIKKVGEGLNRDVVEPTSLHPEQLVGKTSANRVKGQIEYIQNRGYFGDDFIVIDEGKTILTSNDINFSESRRYLRLGLDPYPDNTITKKPVDIPRGEGLEYTPYFNCCIFTQPYYFEPDFATDGDLRRFLVPYINMSGIDRTEAYKARILEVNQDDIDPARDFTEFVKGLPGSTEYKISSEAKAELVVTHLMLVSRGFVYSTKIRNFMDLYDFTIQDLLVKMSYIQALQDEVKTIGKDHVSKALIDLVEFTEHLYQFVENKVMGSLDYGETWNGATDKDKDLLRFLYDEGATSMEESTVSIADYKKEIQEVFEVEERQSIRIKQKHEDNGWIKSKKGKHDSKVWLEFEPAVETDREAKPNQDLKKFYLDKIQEYIPDDTMPLSPIAEVSEVAPRDEVINYESMSDEELSNKATFQDDHEAQAELDKRLLARQTGEGY
ncbi:MAG: hypothetical protein FGO69_08645 [Methanobacterium sp.]|nr:MAG: hypothetical protein FGO69_08645 [Methanobacterium sp.]